MKKSQEAYEESQEVLIGFGTLQNKVNTNKDNTAALKQDNATMRAELDSMKKILTVLFVNNFWS